MFASGITFSGVNGIDGNQQFTALPGDVSSDGRVATAGDVFGVIPLIGSEIGDANYDFRADVNGNGSITVADLFDVVPRLGDFVPVPTLAPASISALGLPSGSDVDDESDSPTPASERGRDLSLAGATEVDKRDIASTDRAFESFGSDKVDNQGDLFETEDILSKKAGNRF